MVPGSRPHDVRYGAIANALQTGVSREITHNWRLYADKELWRNWRATVRKDLDWHWYDWLATYPSPKRVAYCAALAAATAAYELVRVAGAQFCDHHEAIGKTPE
jgi:hypothetical protein